MRKWMFLSLGVLALCIMVSAGQTPGKGTKGGEKSSDPKHASSRIVKVVVYPNSALVTREIDVPAGNGVTEVVVAPMPIRVVPSSLYSEGANGIRILSTRFRTRQVFEDTREDVRKLEDEMKKLHLATQKLVAESKSVEQNMQMIGKLENFTSVTTVSSTEKGGLNGDTVITLAKYIMEQRGDKVKELVDLQQKLDSLKEQTDFARRKMQELTAGTSKSERDAVVVVDRANGAGGTVRLNYLVDAASWRPHYKMRAGKTEEPVQVDYLAALVQQTGEDWSNVELTLSTAQPMLNAGPPELAKLEFAIVARASVPMPTAPPGSGAMGGIPGPAFAVEAKKRGELEGKAKELRSNAENLLNSFTAPSQEMARLQLNEAAGYEQTLDLIKSRDEILASQRKGKNIASNDGPSVTYHLGSRLTVPSRNDEQVVEVAKINLKPKYYHKVVPVLNRNVYRQADMTNTSQMTLLPGEATMYQNNDFVGRMALPLVAIGEEFTAGFGVDPQLQIQREMLDKTREMQGGNQVLTFKYRMLVSSFKDEKVKLQVWDRLPFAEKEVAGIEVIKSTPELSKDALYQRENRPNNLLRWDLDVEPNTNGEKAVPISYEFRLQLDRNMVIGNLLVR
jgi:hypothetical protein